jgi:uncharacterized SAM-binding protein YcdF (DUF218 family)
LQILLAPFKFIGTTGSLTFFAICIVLGVLVWWRAPRWRRAARLWILSICAVHLLLAVPAVALGIVSLLPPGAPPAPDAIPGLERLIVVDGDNRRGRLDLAAQLYRTSSPREIWILGEWWIFENLVHAGVPRERLVHDEAAATTRDQIQQIATLVRTKPAKTAVIASRLQMPRVAALARAAGLDLPLLPSRIDDEPATSGVRHWLPSYFAFRTSRDAIYELFAVAYYRHEGWMK